MVRPSKKDAKPTSDEAKDAAPAEVAAPAVEAAAAEKPLVAKKARKPRADAAPKL